MRLRDRVAVITGASSGVGRATARAFLDEGARVAVCARRLERLKESFAASGRALIGQVDVTEPDQVDRFVESAVARYGAIDVLINNAGISRPADIAATGPADWRATFAVNVDAAFAFCRRVIPLMQARNYGRIINVSSGAAVNCRAGHGAYNASKAALNALTLTLAHEVEGYDIKVNMMSPGPCRTEMAPQGVLEPEAAVETALFLATLPSDGPSGRFFWLMRELTVFPDLSHVNWLNPDVGREVSSH